MLKTRMILSAVSRYFIFSLLMGVILTSCTAIDTVDTGVSPLLPGAFQGESTSATVCSVTEPVWAKPPDDPAVGGSPEFGYYFINQDRSIWASAWWTEAEEYQLHASDEGIKVGWFRPAGTTLEITGRRVDGQAPPLDAHVPCCYPTRFQATGLIFPAEGCWEVTAKAAESELSFIVEVEP
jgi:hypothetical protein